MTFHDGRVELLAGDCLERLKGLPDNSIDAVATDPPYHLTSIVKRFGGETSAAAKDYSGEKEGATGAYARASKGFMGKTWDGGDIAFRVELWREVFRVLKPGGHLAAFSATRTYHRMTVAIEDAGFEVRDMIAWLYGVGFPKSHAVDGGIDDHLFGLWLDEDPSRRAGYRADLAATKALPSRAEQVRARQAVGDKWRALGGFSPIVISEGAPVRRMIPGADQHVGGWEKNDGAEYSPKVTRAATPEGRAWEGWGTALKPALEPICFARKPLSEGSIAANVLRWGTGAIHIDATRIETSAEDQEAMARVVGFNVSYSNGEPSVSLSGGADGSLRRRDRSEFDASKGRWPANVAHDGSPEVVEAFPQTAAGGYPAVRNAAGGIGNDGHKGGQTGLVAQRTDAGSAARFFFSAKADANDRLGSGHPTVKPLDLMRWLVRLITPPGGRVLDPFGGTGTTGHAALLEGFSAVLIEREEAYRADIARRLENAFAADRERRALIAKAKNKVKSAGALFELAGMDA